MQLSPERFRDQLASLTRAVRSISGYPVSYRSGRFGFDASHTAALEQAGYLVDSSVQPLFCETHRGGPDFVDAPLRPYWLSYDSAVRPGNSSVLEVPVSAALNRRVPTWLARAYGRAPRPYQTKRVLRLLRVVKTVWLRPSFSSLDEMNALCQTTGGLWRARPQRHLSLERSHRRRQPLQQHRVASSTRPRSSSALSELRHSGASRSASDLQRIPRRVEARLIGER